MDDFIKYLRCPETGAELEYYEIYKDEFSSGILESNHFGFLYPVIDEIPIMFPLSKKNIQQELEYFDILLKNTTDQNLNNLIKTFTLKLKTINNDFSWEWEDVDFWDNIYHENWKKLVNGDNSFYQKQLPEREFQRKKDFDFIINHKISDGLIFEIGAGSANYTKEILQKFKNNIYVSCDMSINALRIRRKLLNRLNSFYIVCPINNLPFENESAALILLLGILHHTEHKEHNLPYLTKMLQTKGLIYIDEVLYRPSFLPHKNIKKGVNVSAHEEHIFLDGLKYNLNVNGQIKYYKLFHTPFYNLIKNFFPSFVRRSYSSFKFVMLLDKIFMKTFGIISKRFNPGAVTIIWGKNE